MNKVVLYLSILLVAGCCKEKINNSRVPDVVQAKFTELYPGQKVQHWEKEDNDFHAKFEINKLETAVVIRKDGNLIQIENEMEVSELPGAITEYVSKNRNNMKIKEAVKITKNEGQVSYEVEGDDDTDLLFDADGNYLGEEVEDGDDDNQDNENDKD